MTLKIVKTKGYDREMFSWCHFRSIFDRRKQIFDSWEHRGGRIEVK